MSLSATATMTSAIPQLSTRPPLAPPSGPLPALPIAKTRKPLPTTPDAPNGRATPSAPAIPATPSSRTPTRAVTSSGLPTPKPAKSVSTPAVPTLHTASVVSIAKDAGSVETSIPRTIRKTTSIGQFPLPPTAQSRVNSLPPSPLSGGASPSDANALPSLPKGRRDSAKHKSTESVKKPKARSSGYGLRSRQSAGASTLGQSPSLLNGTGDSNLISSARGSDSFLSLPSPPPSRSSSANGSYMTDATQFEDVGEDSIERGRPKSQETVTESKRNSQKDSKGNVLVSVRVRPDAAGDSKTEGEWLVDGRRSLISYKGREGGDYRYDNVFSPHDHNARVYDNAAKRLVRRVMEGYHGTVFAYGMTGTGKTFSMQGTATSPGVIPLAITDIFSYIRENPNREFLLRVSYLEIYNEKIYDLLSQTTQTQAQAPQQEEIKLREDGKRGVYATPLKEEIVQSPNQLLRVIARGDVARRTSSTQFNARSSRSHAVVQIVVESRERTPSHGAYFEKETRRTDRILPGGVLVSTLSLIDLAGSEKAAESKERRTEGAHINKSLLTLGTVIARLSGEDDEKKEDGGKTTEKDKEKPLKHLPYRDSKLTRLLQPALSGDSLVSILCTIQLSSAGTSAAATGLHTGETLNTLKFASRAKNNIVSHAKRNESHANAGDAGSRALLDRYRIEIQDLRAQLEQQNAAKEEAERKEEIEKDRKREEELEREERNRHEEQMLEMQLARTALKERISHLNRLILSSKSLGVNSGRFSSASVTSVPLHRISTFSNNDFGRAVSVRSRDSAHSMASELHPRNSLRDSGTTLEVPLPNGAGLSRAVSVGSITTGVLPAAPVSHLISDDGPALDEEGVVVVDDDDESPADAGDAEASLSQQNRMLQADLADKTRYIATLEKRLLQARRASHSRVSMHFASSRSNAAAAPAPAAPAAAVAGQHDSDLAATLQDRDREIEELKGRLDDQSRALNILRKRDALALRRKSVASEDTARPATSHLVSTSADPPMPPMALTGTASPRNASQASMRSSGRARTHGSSSSSGGGGGGHGHTRSNPSTASRSSSGVVNFSKTPLSSVALLESSPPTSADEYHPFGNSGAGKEAGAGGAEATGKATVQPAATTEFDETINWIDQMIQEKVDSGALVRGERGSLRVAVGGKRDTVMEEKMLPRAVEEEDEEEDDGLETRAGAEWRE